MKNNILNELNKIENENNCQIVFACESGSRAWGFASTDSDYDVRFIYCKPIDWYLRIDDIKDTINAMLANDIDLCGWELKKAMKLFSESNLSLYEWLNSPEIYLRNEKFHTTLKNLIPDYFNPKKALHHYLSMANKIKDEHLKSSQVNIKKVFYIIRPLLACYWIINNQTMPPTEFNKLYIEETIPGHIRRNIDGLLIKKSHAREKDFIELPDELHNWIEVMLSSVNNSIDKVESAKKRGLEPLNELVCMTIKDSMGSSLVI